jgi:Fe2+ or Zn2+ uptake regulation protein
MITNTADLKKVLSSQGIKPTYQRLMILGYIKERRNHPTVDMIYQDLVKEIPTMSKPTAVVLDIVGISLTRSW